MVRLPAPVAAPLATFTLRVNWVLLLKVVLLTVMPRLAKVTAAPLTKFVPVMVRFWLEAPWPRLVGLIELKVGPRLTVKPLVRDPDLPSDARVSVIVRAPVVALLATVILAVICVGLLTVV